MYFFWRKIIGAKAALRMLVKLTLTVIRFTLKKELKKSCNWQSNHHFFPFLSLYRKLVVVCSRASLCNNCHIFQFTFSTKLLLGLGYIHKGIHLDRRQSVYNRDRDRLRPIRDYYNITLLFWEFMIRVSNIFTQIEIRG